MIFFSPWNKIERTSSEHNQMHYSNFYSLDMYMPKAKYHKTNKRTTNQSIRDNEKMELRVHRLGNRIDMVSAKLEVMFGDKFTCSTLLTQAGQLAEALHLKIDRLARRYRKGILCWYTENWDRLEPLLSNESDKLKSPVSDSHSDSSEFIDVSDFRILLNYH